MNPLINQAFQLLHPLGLDYAICGGHAIDLFLESETRPHYDLDISAYWPDRNRIILFMHELGWTVYEACGGGMVHRITDITAQKLVKRNIFCVKDGNTHFHVTDCGDNMYKCEIQHIAQAALDYIEFLFNTRIDNSFVYARNEQVSRAMERAVLYNGSIPYLAPELVLLYKSTDIGREGYQQDFDLALAKMSTESRAWLREALHACYPTGHQWEVKLA